MTLAFVRLSPVLQNRGEPDDLDIAVSAVKGGSAVRSRGNPGRR